MTRARELARLGNENVLSVEDDSLEVGINSTTPTSALDVRGEVKIGTEVQLGTAGIVTAVQFSGNITGVAATFTGDVSIGGTLTYEDVTNIDSVGIVTARAGINMSGGQLLVGSGVTIGYAGVATFSGTSDIHLKDNVKLNVGDSLDLNIYHDGSNSYIQDSGSGALIVTAADQCVFQKGDGSNRVLNLHTTNGTAALMHQGNQKLITSSSGVSVTGDTTADGLIVGSGITFGSAGVATFSGTADVHLRDSVRLNVGDSSDLAIYHDGSHSVIQHANVGNLYINANSGQINFEGNSETLAQFIPNAGVKLYYDNSEKIVTTKDGTVTTGIGTFSGGIDMPDDAIAVFGTNDDLKIRHTSNNSIISHNGAGDLLINTAAGEKIYIDTAEVIFRNAASNETMIKATENASVELYENNIKRLETTTTGISVENTSGDPKILVTGSGHAELTLTSTSGSDHCSINFGDSDDHDIGEIRYTNSSDQLSIDVNASNAIIIGPSGITTFSDTPYDDLGSLRSIPIQSNSGSHTLTAASAGKVLYTDANTNVNDSVFSAGDAVTIVNNSGSSQTITQGSGLSLYNTADASTGNKTLSARGMATIWFASASVAYISGNLS